MTSNQQTCKVCGRPDHWDFYVPDDVWFAVVSDEYRYNVVCLPCFDGFAKTKGVKYKKHIGPIYFVGWQSFELAVVR